jgi:hypothetical protein
MHLTDDDLVLHYYAEHGDEAARVDAHLAACPRCREAFDRLHGVLALVDTAPADEPEPGYERVLWARLQDQLVPVRPWWRRAWDGAGGRLALAGGVAALALATFTAGWLARGGWTEPVRTAATADTGTAATATRDGVRDRVLLLEAGGHLQRSQMALVELMHAGDERFDVAAERERAAELVADNRLLRQSASLQGDDALDDVLEDLEQVLVEVANGPDEVSPEELRAWRERIASGGLLFRLRVLTDETGRREPSDAARPRKGPVS